MEKAPAGITVSFSMFFLRVFGRYPEKFSLGIFSPFRSNTIRLLVNYVNACPLRPSHTEAVRGGGRSKERYGLNRAKIGGSSRGL